MTYPSLLERHALPLDNFEHDRWRGKYLLDHFSTVKEAVEALEKEPFTIVAPVLPNGSPAVGRLAIADPSGDSAILSTSTASW